MKKFRLSILCVVFFVGGCSTQLSTILPGFAGSIFGRPPASDDIRVAIKSNVSSINVKVLGPGSIYAKDLNQKLSQFNALNKMLVSLGPNGKIAINSIEQNYSALFIKPKVNGSLWVDDLCYRGDLTILSKPGRGLTVVNTLDMDEYLMGVLPKETWASWHREALKAQAVAARTFAIYHCQHNIQDDYDIRAPGHQLYGGKSAEAVSTTKAIYDTQDQYLEYHGEVLCTFFYTTCGGNTEEALNIFPDMKEYPAAVKCTHCKASPHYKWSYTVDLSLCADKIKRSGFNLNAKISKIQIISRFKSGRVKTIRFYASQGFLDMSGEKCRQILGYNNVRSTKFKIRIRNNRLEFNGYGWGHGVGMCQWGSKKLAEDGMHYEDILEFYYPKSKLKKSR